MIQKQILLLSLSLVPFAVKFALHTDLMYSHTYSHTETYFVSLVPREGVLSRVLVYPSSDAEAQDQIISLSQLMDLNSLLLHRKKKEDEIRYIFIGNYPTYLKYCQKMHSIFV